VHIVQFSTAVVKVNTKVTNASALSGHLPVVYGTRWACCWQTSRVYSTRMPESIRHLWRFSLRFCGAFCG